MPVSLARSSVATESRVTEDARRALPYKGETYVIQFPLPVLSERDVILEEAYLCLTHLSTSDLLAALPVLAQYASTSQDPSLNPSPQPRPSQSTVYTHPAIALAHEHSDGENASIAPH